MITMIRIPMLAIALFLLLGTGCDFRADNTDSLTYEEQISKANQYLSEGNVERAITIYKKALKTRPNDGKAHFALGEIYYKEWRRTQDLAQRRSLPDEMTNPLKRQKKYTTYDEELKKYGYKPEYKDMAMQEFKEAIKHDSQNWKAISYIATDHFNSKRYKEAIGEYKKIINLKPDHSNSYGLMGEAYFEIGSYDLAVESLNKAIQLNPNSEYDYYTLGKVYLAMNNGEKANEMLSKLKNMNSILYDDLRLYMFSKERK